VVLGLAALYATGVLVLLLRWVGGWLLLRRLRRDAVTVHGAPATLFAACRAELGLRRRVRLATHPLVRSPLTCGLWRPAVLVPTGWPDLPEPAQRGTLLHELAHLARRDDWLALLLGLARTAFFFHPLVHWLLARLECERELICDERAVARGIDRRDYARILLEFARQPARLGPGALAGLSSLLRFGKRRTVKTRIHHLLEENMDRWMKPLPARRALALGAAVLGLALGLGSLRLQALQAEAAPAPPGRAEASADPDQPALPRGPYRVQALHVLKIRALKTLSNLPINGFYLVEPDGKVDLGVPYGKVSVAGLTLDEATAAVEGHLGKLLKDARASVTLAGWVVGRYAEVLRKHPYHVKRYDVLKIRAHPTLPGLPINGPHLVDPDGKVDLGPVNGKVAVAGLTLDEAAAAVEGHLRKAVKDAHASVALAGWEKSWHNLEEQAGGGGGPGTSAAGRPRKEALRYGGKNFDQWRTELVTELKPEVRVEGIRALSTFGANGYGAEAAAAILEVMKGYDVSSGDKDDESVTQAGCRAISKIGVEALPVLRDGLKDENRNVRRFAVAALYRGSPEWEAAVPALLAATRDKDRYVRRVAIRAVETIDPKAKGFIPALVAALQDDDAQVRIQAVRALAQRGPSARAAVPALVGLLKEENVELRLYAIAALRDIKPDAKAVVPALIRALDEKRWDVQTAVIELLGELGPDAKDAVPALIAHLKAVMDPYDRNRVLKIVVTLGQIGPAAKEAVPLLKELALSPNDRSEQKVVLVALNKINR
jgi:beta-lactamase regulating signal transducer with metallopeptidase domain/HEAT repeat protein/protein involved in polysaccharide export with SLBB domain